MTTRLTGRLIDRNTKHLKLIAIGLIAATVAITYTHAAFALEAQISRTQSQAVLDVVDDSAPTISIPSYRHLESGVVVAQTTPITEASTAPVKQVPAAIGEASSAVEILTGNEGVLLALQGEASFYSRAGCLGCSASLTMANGQPLNDNALTMAIGADRKHFVGHTARVTNLATGLSVDVRITDTGGFYKARYGNRVADLTIATKNAIGMTGGVTDVRVEVF